MKVYSSFLSCMLVIVLTMTIEESTAVGRGCATSPCWWYQFSGPCRTYSTGSSGRTQLQRTYKCILGKQRHFCCDPDCGYQTCGSTCETLGLNGNYESVKPALPCQIPGNPPISALQHFCCGV